MGVSSTLLVVVALQAGTMQGIEITDRVEYYRIEGASARELSSQMLQLGPVNDFGRRANGLTRWQVAWRHTSEMHDGACRLTALEVSLNVVTTLPQWRPSRQVRPALVTQWQSFLTKLQQHEATHRQHGLQAAMAVREVAQAIPPQANCHALERAITNAGRKAFGRYAAVSRKYDVLTNFGIKEGVRLHEARASAELRVP